MSASAIRIRPGWPLPEQERRAAIERRLREDADGLRWYAKRIRNLERVAQRFRAWQFWALLLCSALAIAAASGWLMFAVEVARRRP